MTRTPPDPLADTLVILGCGYTGAEVARQARGRYRRVVGTVRDPARIPGLAALGVEVHRLADLSPTAAAALLLDGPSPDRPPHLVVAHPPDGRDGARAALIAAAAAGAPLRPPRIVYLSSTGVYGAARGQVDEDTALDRRSPQAASRIEAEAAWRAAGAVALRAAGIYGPGRGLHLRLAGGDFRLPGDGSQTISRIHVEDLAAAVLAALERGRPGSALVAADATPVPQIEAVAWLCQRLGRPLPPSVPLAEAPESLRGDRAADSQRLRRELGLTLRYPGFREGFAMCLAADLARGQGDGNR